LSWVVGLGLLAAGVASHAALERLAKRAGHADDLTPERLGRARVACLGYGAVLAGLGVWLARPGRRVADELAGALCRDLAPATLREFLKGARRALRETGRLHAMLVLLVCAVGTGVRVRYANVPMDYDEAFSYLNYARRPLYQGLADYNSTNNHLLNTLGMHLGAALGPYDAALRWHVLVAGIVLIPATYVWVRGVADPGSGLLAAAAVAASPVLVNYSVNARAYELLALCSVWLAHGSWRAARHGGHTSWASATAAAVLGLFAAPIMIYTVAGIVVWQLAIGRQSGQFAVSARRVLTWCLVTVVMAGLLYVPAFVFRGFEACHHPFVQPLRGRAWAARFPDVVAEGLSVGLVQVPLDGNWPQVPGGARRADLRYTAVSFVCVVVVAAGLCAVNWKPMAGWCLAAVPLTTLAMMAGQRVAAPPRVFVFLVPHVLALASVGVCAALEQIGRVPLDRSRWHCGLVALVAALQTAALVACIRQPLPYQPESQRWRLAVPAIVQALAPVAQADEQVLVGLPADLPFHYYAARYGLRAQVGGLVPSAGRVYLVIPSDDQPADALARNLSLQIRDPAVLAAPWRPWRDVGALRVWTAHLVRQRLAQRRP
jgi:hypothetical protein